jgi:hypothetical protein
MDCPSLISLVLGRCLNGGRKAELRSDLIGGSGGLRISADISDGVHQEEYIAFHLFRAQTKASTTIQTIQTLQRGCCGQYPSAAERLSEQLMECTDNIDADHSQPAHRHNLIWLCEIIHHTITRGSIFTVRFP